VRLAPGQPVLELLDVQPKAGLGIEAGVLSINRQLTFTQSRVDSGQGPAQIAPCFALTIVGPKQGSQGIAAVALLGHGQVSQQRLSFAQADLDCLALPFETGRAE